jgi:microcystin-dependent protein
MTPFLGQVAASRSTLPRRAGRLCDGRLLPIFQNTALFSLLGMQYGGDGKIDFGLPKLAPVAPGGPNFFIALQGVYPPKFEAD